MIRKDVFQGDVKARLQAASKDRLHRFMVAGGTLRGAVVNATRMVAEMQANHELGVAETLVLGQAYVAAALLTALLKSRERMALQVDCSGPVGGLVVEANVFGEVRGYLKNNPIPLDGVPGDADLSRLFGAGFLTLTRYPATRREPYTGRVDLAYGTLAQDLANYYVQSEQTPTAFHLSVHFDDQGRADGAGGLFLQALPGVLEAPLKKAEALVAGLPSLGMAFSRGASAEDSVRETFDELDPDFSGGHRVEFFCRCTREGFQAYLEGLPASEKEDILTHGPFPLSITCHNCNSTYSFTRAELEDL